VVALSHPVLGTAGFAVLSGPPEAPRVIARSWPLDAVAARGSRAALAGAFGAAPDGGAMPLAAALGDPVRD
jgi:hypothetical protein